MRIGISTASFFIRETTESSLSVIEKMGIPVCEVFLGTFSEYECEFIDELLKRKGNLEVFSVHTLNQQFEPELFNVMPRVRKDCEHFFEKVAEGAGRLGAKYYTFHGPARIKKTPYTFDYSKLGARIEELRKLLCQKSGGMTDLAYENVHWTYFGTPTYFEHLKVHTEVKTCLDIKQAMQSGIDVYTYIDCMGARLANVHLCDYNESGQLFLPGEGTFDFVRLFHTLMKNGYEGPALIEVYQNNYKNYGELLRSYDYLNECLYQAKTYGG